MAVEICDFMEEEKFARIKLELSEDAGGGVKAETSPDGNLSVTVTLPGAATKAKMRAEFQKAIKASADLDFRDIALSLTDDEVAMFGASVVYGAVTKAHDAVYDDYDGELSVCLLTGGDGDIFAAPKKPDNLPKKPRVWEERSFKLADRIEPDSFLDLDGIQFEEIVMYEKSESPMPRNIGPAPDYHYAKSIRKIIETPDAMKETFSNMLFRLIDEKGMSEIECYKKANIDKRLFSKIRSDTNYHPAKNTVIAFAFALKLSLDETWDFLLRAGYSLSPAIEFDRTVTRFIEKGNYDIYDLNIELYSNGLGTL